MFSFYKLEVLFSYLSIYHIGILTEESKIIFNLYVQQYRF